MRGLHIGHVCWGFGMGMALARVEGPYSWPLIAAVVTLGFVGMVLDYLGAFDQSALRPAEKEKGE